MMPLTGLFSGECSANPGAMIPLDVLRQCCNPGYARPSCARAAAIEPDAISFLVKSDRDGVIEVAWALEKNHHPVAVGTRNVGTPAPSAASAETLDQQARMVAASYARQKGRG